MKNTKKKIACLALASALVIPGVMGLAGCEKGHTHAFNSDPYYEVVTEGETKIARSWRECSCGAEDAHRKVDNAVIVNPSNAQEKMDQNINGKVVIFDKDDNGNGVYSTPIDFRPTRDTAKIYTTLDKTNEITDLSTLASNKVYTYERNWENIIFTATEGVDFKSGFVFNIAKNQESTKGNFDHITYDAVKNINLSESAGYHSSMSISNVTFTRINMTGKYGRITLRNVLSGPTIQNININNCTFTTTESIVNQTLYGAIYIAHSSSSSISIKNNKVHGHFQGTSLWYIGGATIEDNEFVNTTHNAIAIQGSSSTNFVGDYIIKNNTIKNVTNRAIRFGSGLNTNITISNNTFENCSEDRTAEKGEIVNEVQMNQGWQLLATDEITAEENKTSRFTFTNNIVDGVLYDKITFETSEENPTLEVIIYTQQPTVYVGE